MARLQVEGHAQPAAAGHHVCIEPRRSGMSMLGSNGNMRGHTAPYAGRNYAGGPHRHDFRNPVLMKYAREAAYEANMAERTECPAGNLARITLERAADPTGQHRMHPEAPVWALSHSIGYAVETHIEEGSCELPIEHEAEVRLRPHSLAQRILFVT